MEWEFIFDLYSDPTANIWISPHHMFYFHGVWTNQTLTKKIKLHNFAQKYHPIDEWILWWIYNLSLSSLCLLFPCFHIFSFSKNIIPISILFVQQSDNIGDKLWCYSTILIVTTKHIMVVHHTSFSTKK